MITSKSWRTCMTDDMLLRTQPGVEHLQQVLDRLMADL
jgi:hypothetical protein